MGRKTREKGSNYERKDYSALLLELQVNQVRKQRNEYKKKQRK